MPGSIDEGVNCPVLLIPVPEKTPPAGEPPVKVIGPALLFIVSNGNCSVTVGVGTTVIVNCIGAPAHPSFIATTVNVEINDDEVVLVAVNDGTLKKSPEPESGIKPMSGIDDVRLHCMVAPGTLLAKTIAGAVVPTQ